MTTDASIVVSVRGDVSGGKVVQRNLDDIANSGDKATASLKKVEGQSASLTRASNLLKTALMGVAGSFGVLQALKIADSYQLLMARVQGVTRATGDYIRISNELFSISQRTGTALEANVQLFQRVTIGARELGKTNSEVLALSETINKLGLLGGASTTALAAGTMQFSQAMAGGILRAEEFNSIMENIPEVGAAIAKGMDLTVGGLRQAVLSGKVLANDVFNALASQSAEIAARFAELPMTLGRAVQMLKNSFQQYVGQLDATYGGTRSLAEAIAYLADHIEELASGVAILAGAMVPLIGGTLVASVKALTIAIAANPLLSGAMVLSGAITALALFDEKLKLTEEGTATLGDAAIIVFDDISKYIKNITQDLVNWFNTINFGLTDISNHPLVQRLVSSGLSVIPTNYVNSVVERAEERAQYKKYDAFRDEGIGYVRDALNGGPSNLYDILGLKNPVAKPGNPPSTPSKATDTLKEIEKNYKALQSAIERGRTPEQDLIARLKEWESMRPFARTAEEAAGLENAIGNARKELDKLRIDAEKNSPLGKAFASIANEIEDGFKDAFKGAFTESDGGWKKLLEGWKATFKNFLAELAYQALARPIIMSVVSGVGSGMGLSSGAVGDILGTSSGGSGLSGISNFASLGKNLFSGLSMARGFSGLYNTGAGIGSSLGLSFEASGLLGRAFGSSPFGAAGGMVASLLGLGSGNMIIDGGLGTAGTMLGGAFGGPIGAAVGGFLGTAVGGLFGGKSVPSNAADISFRVANGRLATGSMSSDEASDERMSQISGMGKSVTDTINALVSSVGGSIESLPYFRIGSTRREPGYSVISGMSGTGKSGEFVFSSFQKAVDFTLSKALSRVELSGVSEQFETVFKKIFSGSGTFEQQAKKVLDAKSLLDLISDVSPQEKAVADAMKAVNDEFDRLRSVAAELGLPLARINEELAKQETAAIGLIKAQQAGFSTMEQMISTFKSFLDGQALGTNSSLSPMGKLELAQGNFGSLLSKAQGGDLSVTQDLLRAANELLNIGRGFYASSVSFAGLETFVRSSVTEIARAAGVPGYATGVESAPAGLAWVGERGPELVRFRGGERVYNAGESAAIANSSARSDAQMMAYFAEWSEEQRNTQKETVKTRKAIERLTSMLASQRRA